jgi:hypothetical protein
VIVRKVETATACRVCGRTLLLGERAIRFSPAEGEWVEVCALCTDEAYRSGWVREGSPTTPLVQDGRRRKRRLHPLGFLERRPEPAPTIDEPLLRRVSEGEQAMLDAAEVFNESPYRRTVAGIAKSLGDPHVSFMELSGTNHEVVLTVAWDLSWYQYRVSLGPTDSVRLAERGYEVDDLNERFRQWNGSLDANGRAVPDIPRI